MAAPLGSAAPDRTSAAANVADTHTSHGRAWAKSELAIRVRFYSSKEHARSTRRLEDVRKEQTSSEEDLQGAGGDLTLACPHAGCDRIFRGAHRDTAFVGHMHAANHALDATAGQRADDNTAKKDIANQNDATGPGTGQGGDATPPAGGDIPAPTITAPFHLRDLAGNVRAKI